ncbi:DNA methyltransferase [Virgibacillus sp. C22-A2]|uniref:DNA methyltransferase n=1 Tax=Virgibacillus tibetensis TaxID=3042313 RepID=A0ABU6KII1_9BACI|nr:DNA methyltransferase [Virgibacillus sp. C22-A2]
MDKLDGKTFDIVEDNIEKMKELFPDIFTEGKIDMDKFMLTLGEHVEKDKERYEFTWNGKTEAIQLAQKQTTGTLRPCKEESVNWDTTKNLYIEGDNLEVLRILQNSYRNKVKMIYIDPPYNTGHDFIYNDDFKDNIKNYLNKMNESLKSNAEVNGRYHTDWLNFLYPRLKISKNILKKDGVIFVSIDDNEYSNLKKVMDEIFGENNFLATFVWKRRASSAMADRLVSTDHEYVICYQNGEFTSFNGLEKEFKGYSNPDGDPRGDWTKGDLTVGMTKEQRPNQYYDIKNPKTGKIYKPSSKRIWAYIKESMDKLIDENKIVFPDDENQRPMYKRFKHDMNIKVNPISTWINEGSKLIEDNAQAISLSTGLNSEGTKVIQELFDYKAFDYPKPTSLIKSLIKQVCDEGDIVLDFFAGSSTTAQSLLEVSEETNKSISYILVQIPEKILENSQSYNDGLDDLCKLGRERIKKFIAKSKINYADSGFKVFKLDETNLHVWDEESLDLEKDLMDMIDPVKEGRTQEDVVYEILLKYGVDLTIPIEKKNIAGKSVYDVGMGYLLICLERDITLDIIKQIAEKNPARVVFYDEGFKDDTVRTNAQQILKRHNVEDIRVI